MSPPSTVLPRLEESGTCKNVRSGDGIPGTSPSRQLSPPAVHADQDHAGHRPAEQLRVLARQRHDRHAAHRMADEDDAGAAGDHGPNHRLQVAAGLPHGDRLPGSPAGTAVAALVPEHQPGRLVQLAPLVVPAVLLQRVPGIGRP